jgi:hypothetical protein
MMGQAITGSDNPQILSVIRTGNGLPRLGWGDLDVSGGRGRVLA